MGQGGCLKGQRKLLEGDCLEETEGLAVLCLSQLYSQIDYVLNISLNSAQTLVPDV